MIFYALAAALGALIGAAEIISRYRDAPYRALCTVSAWLYISLNILASSAAYALVREIPQLNAIGGQDGDPSKQLIQALAAGLSAMALFRSSLFTVRVANMDIGIGPAAFLQILLFAADRATDRARARPRAAAVQEIMLGISFERAKEALPSLCFGLMQGLSTEEQATFGIGVKGLESSDMEDAFKANSLGLSLMNLVGEDVLRQAVNMLRTDISAKPRPIVQSILTLQLLRKVDFAKSKQTLVDVCLFIANKMGDSSIRESLTQDLSKISALLIRDAQKVLILSAALIDRFGEQTVQFALKAIADNERDATSDPTHVVVEKKEPLSPDMPSDDSRPPQVAEAADEKVVRLHSETPAGDKSAAG